MMKKILRSPITTVVLFGLAAVLLVTGTIGGVRAAPNLESNAYGAQVQLSSIDTAIVEGKGTAAREVEGAIMENLLAEGETFKIGKKYEEVLSVKNTGAIDEYVRVYVYKYWTDEDGNKVPTMDPDLIELTFDESKGWKIAEETDERTVLYYTNPATADGTVAPGKTTNPFLTHVKISSDAQASITKAGDSFTYDYDGLTFHIEAVADAVQQHNGTDAMTGAWGRTN